MAKERSDMTDFMVLAIVLIVGVVAVISLVGNGSTKAESNIQPSMFQDSPKNIGGEAMKKDSYFVYTDGQCPSGCLYTGLSEDKNICECNS